MLIDETFITVQAGRGGDGMVSFFPNKSGPSGGCGGQGAAVYAVADSSITSLFSFSKKHIFVAQNGGNGGSFQKTGADAPDLELRFPVGTELTDNESGKKIELLKEGQRYILCFGGKGGRGNEFFKSATNRVPRYAEKGTDGQRRQFKVVMRLIADVGLIGLPNAGKSSLLNELTEAHAKIAPYPFTTLEPNLGALGKVIIADIPGLIEGASSGKGLGTKFLKHIEKVKILLHCVSCESSAKDMVRNYDTVRRELVSYNSVLADKKEYILLTKSDLLRPQDRKRKLEAIKALYPSALLISIHDFEAIESLKNILRNVV